MMVEEEGSHDERGRDTWFGRKKGMFWVSINKTENLEVLVWVHEVCVVRYYELPHVWC